MFNAGISSLLACRAIINSSVDLASEETGPCSAAVSSAAVLP